MADLIDRKRLVLDSLNLAERVRLLQAGQLETGFDSEAARRLNEWQKYSAAGDEVRFARRLAWDDLTLDDARRLVGDIVDAPVEVPSWVAVVDRACEIACAGDTASLWQAASNSETNHFASFVAPFVAVASRELSDAGIYSRAEIGDQVRAQVDASLTEQLSAITTQALSEVVKRFTDGQVKGTVDESWEERLADGLFVSIVQSHAALSRLLATRVELHIANTKNLLERFCVDRGMLRHFFPTEEVTQLRTLHTSAGDSHQGGQTVHILELDGGRSVVYKPRSGAMMIALAETIDRLGFDVALPRVIERDGYCWEEFVATATTISDLDRAFAALGTQLAVMHAFGTADMHTENFVLTPNGPVPVDLEMLMRPARTSASTQLEGSAAAIAERIVRRSAEHCLILPVEIDCLHRADHTHDMSPVSAWVSRYSEANDMPVAQVYTRAADATLATFSAAQARIQNIPDSEVEQLGKDFADAHGRWLVRRTTVYANMLKDAITPHRARVGIERSIYLDRVRISATDSKDKTDYWPMYGSEVAQLEVGDVPFFSFTGSGWTVCDSDGPLYEVPNGSAVDSAIDGFLGLTDQEQRWNERKIQSMFRMAIKTREEPAEPSDEPVESDTDSWDAVAVDELLDTVNQLLHESAIHGSNGDACWIADDVGAGSSRGQANDSLYSGSAGIALFLATSAARCGSERDAALAIAAMKPLLDEDLELSLEGGFGGIAASAYALAWAGELLGWESGSNRAVQLAQSISFDDIEQDDRLDLLNGDAGVLKALATVYRFRPAEAILERIVACADQLVANATIVKGEASWETTTERDRLCGISHGAAGIASALATAWSLTGNDKYREIALAAVRFEDARIDPATGLWPDLRTGLTGSHSGPAYLTGWCHGAAGIALSRSDVRNLIDDQGSATLDAVHALNAVRDRDAILADHLCCGESGAILSLYRAARDLDDPQWRRIADARLAGRLQAWSAFDMGIQGQKRLLDIQQVPGLFTGLAGIGLVLLESQSPASPMPDPLRLS